MSSRSDEEPSAQTPDALPDLTGRRVVICEDEGVTLMQLRRTLTQAGLSVVGMADNGEMAVEAALRERPELILMDIRMPKMDGLKAARQILAEYSVCIVMLTAFSDEAYQQEAREMGASGYLIKPISRDLLLPALQKALAQFESKNS